MSSEGGRTSRGTLHLAVQLADLLSGSAGAETLQDSERRGPERSGLGAPGIPRHASGRSFCRRNVGSSWPQSGSAY
jgi:hypothetical protein